LYKGKSYVSAVLSAFLCLLDLEQRGYLNVCLRVADFDVSHALACFFLFLQATWDRQNILVGSDD